MAPHPAERTTWHRCVTAGVLVFSLSVGGSLLSSEHLENTHETMPASAQLVAYALDRVTPELQLVQVGRWLARTLFERPSRCRA